ncbi:MAG: hypothetical protein LC660_15275, partial [Desulfobacteraceae bacterium]|nr:hypothetical protein [Desulfobacteraceae bacterium]
MVTGCTGTSDFKIQNLAKTDMDMAANIHLDQAVSLLKTLAEKLYNMNSTALLKTPGATIDSRINQIFQCPPPPFSSRPSAGQDSNPAAGHDIDALENAFDPHYSGDRVHAVVLGLYTMIHKSYAGKCELYIMDFLDAQNLYNSARNIEIVVWRLSNRKDADGSLLLASNQCGGPVQNLSFERLFGKLISLQDTMARMVAS